MRHHKVSRVPRIAASILMAVACAAAMAPRQSAEPPSPLAEAFERGETLDFNLSYFKVVGGSARMTISPLPGDPGKLRITSVAQSSGAFARFFQVRDEIQSVVVRATLSALHYHKKLDERGRRRDEITVVDEARHIATRNDEEIVITTPVFDPLSLVYQLRRLDLSPGRTHRLTVLSDGKVFPVDSAVTRRETVTTDAGTFKTVVVEPRMNGGGLFGDGNKRLVIWYSDDERRLPVRIRSDVKVGTITATLRAVSSGVAGIDAPAETTTSRQ
ncbi:MAG TPA: DUF3108 domain-containing protein [Thermoanaerobaculia bacterium]|nr:DUF3108 domain-containing protein [Thermoanaerobaculia bacterium]